MSPRQPLPPKKEVALALLERSSVHLHLDPRLEGVVVPPVFRKKESLVLQVGLNMAVPIPDLQLDDEGMSCTLSFDRSPFFCVVPWASVFAIVGDDGRGMVWPDDVPPEVAQQGAARAAAEAARKEQAPTGWKAQPKRAPLAEVRTEAAPTKAKRPRKKPQAVPAAAAQAGEAAGARPRERLAAVPSSRGEAPSAQGEAHAPARGHGGASKPAQPPVRSEGATSPARKPKRELPPYLRVVK